MDRSEYKELASPVPFFGLRDLIDDEMLRPGNIGFVDPSIVIFGFVKERISYQSTKETKPAARTLRDGWGDCADQAVLFAALSAAINYKTRIDIVRTQDGENLHAVPVVFRFSSGADPDTVREENENCFSGQIGDIYYKDRWVSDDYSYDVEKEYFADPTHCEYLGDPWALKNSGYIRVANNDWIYCNVEKRITISRDDYAGELLEKYPINHEITDMQEYHNIASDMRTFIKRLNE